jgi:hypothetical protein
MNTFARLVTAVAVGATAACVVALPATAAPRHVVAVTPAPGEAVPGHYIVTVTGDARAVAAAAHVTPRYTYDRALDGFAAALDDHQLDALRHDPRVVRIEQDAVVHADTVQPLGPTQSWGLDRIDQRSLPLDGNYSDFGGRAHVAYDALGGNGIDCNGHGTEVAGIVGGTTYGVAKAVTLWSVRVLDCNGSGSYSAVIAGLNWVASYHTSRAVAVIGVGGGYSSSLNDAVTNMSNSGVFTAVGAGSSNADACSYSPSSAYGTVTAAASESNDYRASFSNYGACVDLYAPGVNVPTDGTGGPTTMTSTVASAAFVTGAGALYKGDFGDASWQTVANWIINNATPNVIKNNPSGTPNRLLYVGGL